MDVKQEPSDPDEPMIKTETVFVTGEANENLAFSRKTQIFKNERDDVNDSDNIFEIKQEVIKCEVSQIQQSSTTNNDPARENIGIFNTFIKKEIEDSAMDIHEVKATDMFVNIAEIKQEICEFAQPKIKSELLTSHCDLPTLKDENVYPDYFKLEQPCSSKQAERISTSLKSTAKRVPMKKKRGYPCPVCLKNFSTSRLRLDHFCRHFEKRPKTHWSPLSRKDYSKIRSEQACCYCGRFLLNKWQFLTHFIVYHYVKKLLTKSPLKSKYRYKVLVDTHKNKNYAEAPFKCYICSNQYKHKSSLNTHLKIHTESELFKCEICLKQFIKKSHLNRHLKIHNGEKLFTCKICSKHFIQKNSLNSHLLIHGEKPFECKICLRCFKRKSDLNSHLLIHATEKSSKCEICFKHFSRKAGLKRHLKIHTRKLSIKCEICSKQFINEYCFEKHLKAHTGEKPFKCKICSKSFSQKWILNKHFQIHTGEKPFKCEICSKQFIQKNNLDSHLKTHTGEKPFNCEICSKQFSRKFNLKTHLKIHIGNN